MVTPPDRLEALLFALSALARDAAECQREIDELSAKYPEIPDGSAGQPDPEE